MTDERNAPGTEETERKKSLRRSWKSSGPVAKLTVVFAGIAAVAGVTYAFTSIWQLSVMSDQLTQIKLSSDQTERAVILNMGQLAIANRNAKTAENANALTEESLVSVQRAFVSMDTIRGLASPDYAIFQFTWKNSGATPTKALTGHVSFQKRYDKLPPDFDFPDIWFPGERHIYMQGLIGPQSSVFMPAKIPMDDVREVQAGKARYYLWGWSKYRDVFPGTHEHITEFCFEFFGLFTDPYTPHGITPSVTPCDTHNCGDEQCKDYEEKTKR